MARNILIWGAGNSFKRLYPYYKKEVEKNNIHILACIDKVQKANSVLDIDWISKKEIDNYKFDYIVISSSKYCFEIMDEIIVRGIAPDKIIDGRWFAVPHFDFLYFEREKYLNTIMLDGGFVNNTYADFDRIYQGQNGSQILLGKKSFVAESFIEGILPDRSVHINIGRYSSLSWDVHWEFGLNLDHDYHRVCTYGVTHLADFSAFDISCLCNDCSINIGNDVWIGRGVHLKAGIKVGDGAVVASNSIVVNDVKPFSIVGGNPARFIKYRFSEDIIEKLREIRWWNWDSEEILKYAYLFNNPSAFVNRFYKV